MLAAATQETRPDAAETSVASPRPRGGSHQAGQHGRQFSRFTASVKRADLDVAAGEGRGVLHRVHEERWLARVGGSAGRAAAGGASQWPWRSGGVQHGSQAFSDDAPVPGVVRRYGGTAAWGREVWRASGGAPFGRRPVSVGGGAVVVALTCIGLSTIRTRRDRLPRNPQRAVVPWR